MRRVRPHHSWTALQRCSDWTLSSAALSTGDVKQPRAPGWRVELRAAPSMRSASTPLSVSLRRSTTPHPTSPELASGTDVRHLRGPPLLRRQRPCGSRALGTQPRTSGREPPHNAMPRGRRCRSAPSAAITHLTPSLTSSGRARDQAARQAVGTSALRLRARGLRELSRQVGSCLPQQRGGDRLGIDAVDGRPGVRTGHRGAQKHSHHCRWPPQLVRSWPLRWRAEGVRVLLRVLMSPPPP